MTDPPIIIRSNKALYTRYQQLQKNDIICGRIRLKPGEEHLLTDLLQRGIHLIPSATSQLASRSKCFQTRIFSEFMLPDTLVIYDLHDLLGATSHYRRQQHTKVILKHDGKNAGLGIHLFGDIEELYNQVSIGSFPFPFVIQPYLIAYRDIRVIMLGDYVEAYERINPHNFRKNLHCGGKSKPIELEASQRLLCREVMERGNYPYGHIDLLIEPDGNCHLLEINLRGGLKGAQISGRKYQEYLEHIHNDLLASLTATKKIGKRSPEHLKNRHNPAV